MLEMFPQAFTYLYSLVAGAYVLEKESKAID